MASELRGSVVRRKAGFVTHARSGAIAPTSPIVAARSQARRPKLQQQTNPQRFFVAGQAVELWENPLLPFGCALNDLESYCLNARWDLLFNAIVIVCNASQDAEDDEPIRPTDRCLWAGGPGAPPGVGH